MANPIPLLVLLTLCCTFAMGVPSSPSDCKHLSSYKAKRCEAKSKLERPLPIYPSIDLSLNLLRHLCSPSRNLVFSPYSLVTSLTMALLGADGNSRKQLLETLFGSVDERRVERFIAQHRHLTKYNAEQLQIENFLYPDTSFPLKPEYHSKVSTDFGAITRTVNFKASSAMETINSDVSEATHGMIREFFTEIDPETALLLINTVYFKGMWNIPFKEANTDLKGTFTKSPGGEVMQIPMMHHYDVDLPFLEESDGTKCLLLPYNVPHMHLALLLPPKDQPIESFVRNLTGTFLEPLLAERFSGFRRSVNVALPRFKIASTHSKLVETLESLGVKDIFSPNKANLSKLTQNWEQLYVDQVLQKATIEVNEEGTKASAATAVRMVYFSADFKEFDFIADRPFVYALLRAPNQPPTRRFSQPTSRLLPDHGQILFMGVLEDPSKE